MQVPVETPDWRLGDKPTSGFSTGYLEPQRPLADFCNFFDFGGHGTEASPHLAEEPLAISQNETPYVKNEKFVEAIKCETEFIRNTPTPPFATYPLSQCPPIEAPDIFDMSSFFQDHDEKANAEGGGGGGDFEDLLAPPPSGAFPEGSGVRTMESPSYQPSGGSTETVAEELLDADASVDSVVMGIPYYVACQWQQMQQQHQQQQQAVMMLWWQAYLSGAYNMMGPKSLPASTSSSTQVNWPFAHGLNFFGEDSLSTPLRFAEECTTSQKKRRKTTDSSDLAGTGTKKGRRSKQTERVCKNCGTNATPFWRKDKQDGRPLCNACGLYLSKNAAPRPKVLWKYNERSPLLIV